MWVALESNARPFWCCLAQQAFDDGANSNRSRRSGGVQRAALSGARGYAVRGARIQTLNEGTACLSVNWPAARSAGWWSSPSHHFPPRAVLPLARRLELLRWANHAERIHFRGRLRQRISLHGDHEDGRVRHGKVRVQARCGDVFQAEGPIGTAWLHGATRRIGRAVPVRQGAN
jgi:hypothetical protein